MVNMAQLDIVECFVAEFQMKFAVDLGQILFIQLFRVKNIILTF